jgi:uncharacterized membrane protein
MLLIVSARAVMLSAESTVLLRVMPALAATKLLLANVVSAPKVTAPL